LEVDFHARYGFSVAHASRLGWHIFDALIIGVHEDSSSHTFASVAGWSYRPAPAEVAFYNWVDAQAVMNRSANAVRPKPVTRPWEIVEEHVTGRLSSEDNERRLKLEKLLGVNGLRGESRSG
jgi:hypothetical protein